MGVESDLVGAAGPDVAFAGDECCGTVLLAVGNAEVAEGEMDPGLVGLEGIEVDGGDDDIAVVGGGLAVAEYVVVIGPIKPKVVVFVEGRVFAPDSVESGNVLL